MSSDSARVSATGASLEDAPGGDLTLAGDDAGVAAPAVVGTLARGTIVGRYVVLSSVGAGGMGVVYAAYDPELGRKVALKLLRPRAGGSESGQGSARLVREARALARLSHPNVVAIYDVGTHGDEVWLAMEFVEGRTLAAFCAERKSGGAAGWIDPLRVLVDAARGLAAAHEAGIVHRDFKPANVMLGDDGRVRVMDLGLARSTASEPQSDVETLDAIEHAELGDAPMDVTRAGALVGTPAYMAPEQLAGLTIDMRADQFSWCVTAWEALFGERPFAGETPLELAGNVLAGRRRPTSRSDVPRWIRRALDRGLAVDRDRRWPKMIDLLDALARGRVRARMTRVAAGLAGLAVAGAAVYGWTALDRARRIAACEAAGDRIAELWNDDARARVQDGVAATGVVFAASTTERLIPWFDRHATEWREATTAACLAIDVREQWNEGTNERAAWCLDDRWLRIEALLVALANADPNVARGAVAAVASIPSSASCTDPNRLASEAVPPPERREAVRALRGALSEVMRLQIARKYDDALVAARDASERAATVDWPPLHAEALLEVARLLEQRGEFSSAEAALEEAFFIAEAANATDESAKAATALASLVGAVLARPIDARRWARLAEIRITEIGDASLLLAEYRTSFAAVQRIAGEYEAQKQSLAEAVELQTSLLGPDHPQVAATIDSLAEVVYDLGAYDEAKALNVRARAVWEAALGPDHPELWASTMLLGRFQLDAGEYDEAMVTFDGERVRLEAMLGPDHPDIARVIYPMSRVHFARGENDEAEALVRRAIVLLEPDYGPEHPMIAILHDNLGSLHWIRGEYDAARTEYGLALTAFERRLGVDHPTNAGTLNNLGVVEFATDHLPEAEQLHRRSLAINVAALGAEHPSVAIDLHNLGDVHAAMGRTAEARVEYERALAIRTTAIGPEHPHIAETLFELAVLDDMEGDRVQARARYDRVIAMIESTLGPHHEAMAQGLIGLSLLLLEEGQREAAQRHAERALALRERAPVTAFRLAMARLQVALCSGDSPAELERGRTLATDALAVFETEGRGKKYADEARRWLAAHPKPHG